MKPKLPADLPQREWIRALERDGYTVRRYYGSHCILRKGGVEVSVPKKVDQHGTVRRILNTAGISIERFERLRRGKG